MNYSLHHSSWSQGHRTHPGLPPLSVLNALPAGKPSSEQVTMASLECDSNLPSGGVGALGSQTFSGCTDACVRWG